MFARAWVKWTPASDCLPLCAGRLKPKCRKQSQKWQISVVSRHLIHTSFEESTYPQSQAGKINYWPPMAPRSKATEMSWTSSLRRSMRTCMRNIIWNGRKLQLLMAVSFLWSSFTPGQGSAPTQIQIQASSRCNPPNAERKTWDQKPSTDGFAFWEISLCNLEEAAALRSCATWEVVRIFRCSVPAPTTGDPGCTVFCCCCSARSENLQVMGDRSTWNTSVMSGSIWKRVCLNKNYVNLRNNHVGSSTSAFEFEGHEGIVPLSQVQLQILAAFRL